MEPKFKMLQEVYVFVSNNCFYKGKITGISISVSRIIYSVSYSGRRESFEEEYIFENKDLAVKKALSFFEYNLKKCSDVLKKHLSEIEESYDKD